MRPVPDLTLTSEGDEHDAHDAADHRIDMSNLDALIERIEQVPDGDKDAAKALYRDLVEAD